MVCREEELAAAGEEELGGWEDPFDGLSKSSPGIVDLVLYMVVNNVQNAIPVYKYLEIAKRCTRQIFVLV